MVYDLSEWDDESCVALLDALSADTIPYGLDGDELVIGAVDEKRVDEIVAALTTPGAILTVGGPGELRGDERAVRGRRRAQQRPRRQGSDPCHRRGSPRRRRRQRSVRHGPWLVGRVVARAGALADLVETPNADPEHIVELATAVRSELRPYI